jgi:hypothetical protein
MPKPYGVFFLPFLSLLSCALLVAAPKLAPRGFSMTSFHQLYPTIVAAITGFSLYTTVVALLASNGILDRSRVTAGAGVLGYCLGYKDVVATLLLSKKGVKIGLAHGATLSDPTSLLKGAGKVHRHIELRTPEQLQRPEVKHLLQACLTEWRRRMEAKQSKPRNGTSIP